MYPLSDSDAENIRKPTRATHSTVVTSTAIGSHKNSFRILTIVIFGMIQGISAYTLLYAIPKFQKESPERRELPSL